MVDRGGGLAPANMTFGNLKSNIVDQLPAVATEWNVLSNAIVVAKTQDRGLKIMFGGDSIGGDTVVGIASIFKNSYKFGVQDACFRLGFPYWYSSPSSFSSEADLWWGDGQTLVVNSGATDTWSGGFKTADNIKLWYVKDSLLGTATVETSPNGSTWTTVASFSTSGTRSLNVTNISISRAAIMVRVTASGGVVKYIWAEMEDSVTRGAKFYTANAGGKYMSQFLGMSTASIATILTNLQPDIVVWSQLKESWDRTNFPAFKTLINTYCPQADIVLVSTHRINPAAEAAAATADKAENLVKLDRSIARTNGWSFVDQFSGQSWSNVVENSFNSDNVHFYTTAGQRWKTSRLVDSLDMKGLCAIANASFPNAAPRTNATDYGSIEIRTSAAGEFMKFTNDYLEIKIPSTGGGGILISNGWAPGRTAIYLGNQNYNWNFAGNADISAVRGTNGIYIYTVNKGDGYTGNSAQFFPLGGFATWKGSPSGSDTTDPGAGGWRANHIVSQTIITNGAAVWHVTNATPSFSYPNGSIAVNTSGGSGTTFYVREAGNWVAK